MSIRVIGGLFFFFGGGEVFFGGRCLGVFHFLCCFLWWFGVV